jgi:hypothetical protein
MYVEEQLAQARRQELLAAAEHQRLIAQARRAGRGWRHPLHRHGH